IVNQDTAALRLRFQEKARRITVLNQAQTKLQDCQEEDWKQQRGDTESPFGAAARPWRYWRHGQTTLFCQMIEAPRCGALFLLLRLQQRQLNRICLAET